MTTAADLPTPPVPANCDLTGFPFMPLDCARLLDSDLFALATGEEFKAAVSLWCKSWAQVPAGSLSDDPRVLAHLAGVPMARWKNVGPMAMRGWTKASDGRLYHPVVSAKAAEAWSLRERQRDRGRRGNAVRWGSPEDRQRIPEGSPARSLDDRKGQGQGQGQGQAAAPSEPCPAAPAAADPMDMDLMQRAPEPAHVTQACDRRTFGDWRTMVAHRIFWTREEDEVWKSIFQAEGWDEMTKGYNFLAKKHPAPKKIFVSMIQELRE